MTGFHHKAHWPLALVGGSVMLAASMTMAEDPKFSNKDVSQIRTFVDRADVTLAEAIRKAEAECRGKAISADAMCDHSHPGAQGAEAGHYIISCLAEGRVVKVCVDSKDGRILATHDHRTAAGEVDRRYIDNRSSTDPRTGSARSVFRMQKATDLIGMNVQNTSGENLGEIQDLALDPDRELRVAYFVLASGGFLGLGEKWFAIPTGALSMGSNERHLVLPMDKDRMKNAHGFEKDRWPKMGDVTWGTGIHEFYGQRPYWSDDQTSTSGTMRIMKASELLGRPVHNDRGENIGEIKDLAVDEQTGRIVYAVLSFGGFVGVGDKYFAIPPALLQTPASGSYSTLRVDKEQLKNAQGFDKSNWPNMADQTFATSVYSYYGQTPYWSNDPSRR